MGGDKLRPRCIGLNPHPAVVSCAENCGTYPQHRCAFGNGSFIILVSGSDYITVEDIINLFKLRLEGREEYPELKIEYKIGIAETFKEHQTARKLFAKAIQNKKEYVCEPRETDI